MQKELYSGHKRVHCLKFQAITLPNGLILHLSQPYPGRRHDSFILKDTHILQQLRLYCPTFCLYGDEGYPLKSQLIRPYSNTRLTEQQQLFNKKMSRPVGKYYFVATLLTNAHSCIYGSLTSKYFNIDTPDLFEYFQ
ncbi:hypothetical protein Zmor_028299 [Zophobas morio]|uniref:DDE Tnp4 domain-containing protein n=1 Tax=Zophobas morio TaxID=2755281 RepID=A0AA38M3C6_9CUCU|nr:hypothetical protein Zmor_028299 [Zophobas morio]